MTMILFVLSIKSYASLHLTFDPQNGLLGAGYIPSKITYRTIIQALELRTELTMRRKKSVNNKASKDLTETFQFLLFVLDTLENRKLTVDSSFYSAVLILGAQNRGLHKRIAYYMSEGRRRHKEMSLKDEKVTNATTSIIKWEQLLLDYSSFKEKNGSVDTLPLIRVSSKDFGSVLAAEQAVQYHPHATKR